MPIQTERPGVPVSELEDRHLVAEFLQGRESAFEMLFRKYQDRIFSFCNRFLGNRTEAEDAMQESFLVIYYNLNSFRGDSSFLTWALAIAIRKCIERSRKARRRPTVPMDLTEDIASQDTAPVDRIMLRQTLGSLPDDYRVALILKYYQQLSYEEMADALGCNIGQVKIRLHRARNLMKDLLREEMGGGLR